MGVAHVHAHCRVFSVATPSSDATTTSTREERDAFEPRLAASVQLVCHPFHHPAPEERLCIGSDVDGILIAVKPTSVKGRLGTLNAQSGARTQLVVAHLTTIEVLVLDKVDVVRFKVGKWLRCGRCRRRGRRRRSCGEC